MSGDDWADVPAVPALKRLDMWAKTENGALAWEALAAGVVFVIEGVGEDQCGGGYTVRLRSIGTLAGLRGKP